LSTYTFAVATGEVLRQCRGQNVKRVDLELGYVGNGSLVVGPGLVIGLQYPITMEIMSFQETSEGNRTSVISASSQIPLNLFHVVISGSVFQTSPNPRKISVISVRKSKLSAVPLIDVSIRASTADILLESATVQTPNATAHEPRAAESQDNIEYTHLVLTIIILVILIGVVLISFCLMLLLMFMCRKLGERKKEQSLHNEANLTYDIPLVSDGGNQTIKRSGPCDHCKPPPLPKRQEITNERSDSIQTASTKIHYARVKGDSVDEGNIKETHDQLVLVVCCIGDIAQ
jgi:hypothetical protein